MSLWSVQRPVSSSSFSLHPSPCQLSRKCLPLVTGGTSQAGSEVDRCKSIISPNASLKCRSSARQTSHVLFLHRDGGVARRNHSWTISASFFLRETFPPLVLKINADWCLLRDWGSLKIWCPVILGVGRSKFQVLGKTCRVLETGHLGEWCQAREGSMKQLGSSGEAETTRSSWTNAGGQAVFVDTDFSPSVPIWEETSKPITQQKHRVDFLCLTPLPRCWPRTDRSSVGPMPFENGVTFLLHVLFLE